MFGNNFVISKDGNFLVNCGGNNKNQIKVWNYKNRTIDY